MHWILGGALVAALAAPAAAGEGDPFDRAMDGAPPSGVRAPGTLGQAEGPGSGGVPRAPGVPVAPPAAPAPAAAPSTGEWGPVVTESGIDASVEVNANYDVALGVYSKILESAGTDTTMIDRRIAANEEIVARYSPQMNAHEEELRKLQVEFMNRAFKLRQQRDAGALTEDRFQKAIIEEEGGWNRKKGAIAGDAAFFRDEVEQAQARLVALRAQKTAVEERLAREGRLKPRPKPPGEALFEGLGGTLERLSGFKTRYTMDGGARCQSCNSFDHGAEGHE